MMGSTSVQPVTVAGPPVVMNSTQAVPVST